MELLLSLPTNKYGTYVYDYAGYKISPNSEEASIMSDLFQKNQNAYDVKQWLYYKHIQFYFSLPWVKVDDITYESVVAALKPGTDLDDPAFGQIRTI